ncbi:hypothetical protein DET50_101132 [Marinobacter pelagius]|uniref:Uncharacterized protein n=1 Tax=Marinobacter pelagius TaxID=379482 RepID=A0A366GYX9_9GAMM|nr:hypothetical protein [Marinobacter pelagius]RBP33790.1 hypothetical protein DET50_101132 [Marinobacter pelagius]
MKTLSSKGLTEKDLLVLKSLVDLMMSRTSDTWEYAESDNCDAIIIDTDNLKNSAAIIDEIEAQHAVAIEYSAGASAGKTRFRIKKPLRAADLIAVFNSVEAGLAPKNDAKPSAANNETPAQAGISSSRDSGTLDLLNGPESRFLRVTANNCECIIDLANDRYKVTGDAALDELLRSSEKSITLSATSGFQESFEPSWQDAPSLKWKLGIFLSEGELIKTLHSKSRFKLLRWPPSDIPRTMPTAMALSALLSRKSGATIEEALSETNVSSEEAIGFVNGAYLSGVLSVRAFNLDNHGQQPIKTEHTKGLFDKIRDRLKRKPK